MLLTYASRREDRKMRPWSAPQLEELELAAIRGLGVIGAHLPEVRATHAHPPLAQSPSLFLWAVAHTGDVEACLFWFVRSFVYRVFVSLSRVL